MFPYSFAIELACFIFAIVFLRKEKNKPWNQIPWFILLIALVDGTGWVFGILNIPNQWIYNAMLVIFTLIITRLFHHFYRPLIKNTNWIIVLLGIFCTAFVIESLNKKLTQFNDITFTLTGVLFTIASCWYYYLLLKSEEPLQLLKHPDFWIVTGIFMFHFGTAAPAILFEKIMDYEVINEVPVWEFILPILNLILYGCWTYAFRLVYRGNTSLQ